MRIVQMMNEAVQEAGNTKVLPGLPDDVKGTPDSPGSEKVPNSGSQIDFTLKAIIQNIAKMSGDISSTATGALKGSPTTDDLKYALSKLNGMVEVLVNFLENAHPVDADPPQETPAAAKPEGDKPAESFAFWKRKLR